MGHPTKRDAAQETEIIINTTNKHIDAIAPQLLTVLLHQNEQIKDKCNEHTTDDAQSGFNYQSSLDADLLQPALSSDWAVHYPKSNALVYELSGLHSIVHHILQF